MILKVYFVLGSIRELLITLMHAKKTNDILSDKAEREQHLIVK